MVPEEVPNLGVFLDSEEVLVPEGVSDFRVNGDPEVSDPKEVINSEVVNLEVVVDPVEVLTLEEVLEPKVVIDFVDAPDPKVTNPNVVLSLEDVPILKPPEVLDEEEDPVPNSKEVPSPKERVDPEEVPDPGIVLYLKEVSDPRVTQDLKVIDQDLIEVPLLLVVLNFIVIVVVVEGVVRDHKEVLHPGLRVSINPKDLELEGVSDEELIL